MDKTKNQKNRNDSTMAQKSSLINKASHDLECSNEFNRELKRRNENNNLEFDREFNRQNDKNNLEFDREFNRQNDKNNLECSSEFDRNRNNLEVGKDYITTTNPSNRRDRYATSSVTNIPKTNVEFAKEVTTKSTTEKSTHKGSKKK